jgi:hypothetical protein
MLVEFPIQVMRKPGKRRGDAPERQAADSVRLPGTAFLNVLPQTASYEPRSGCVSGFEGKTIDTAGELRLSNDPVRGRTLAKAVPGHRSPGGGLGRFRMLNDIRKKVWNTNQR